MNTTMSYKGVSKNSISRVKKFSMIQANYGRKVSDSEVWNVSNKDCKKGTTDRMILLKRSNVLGNEGVC